MSNFPTSGLAFRVRGASVATSNSGIAGGGTFSSVADEVTATVMANIGGATPLPVYQTNQANGQAALVMAGAVLTAPDASFMQDLLYGQGFTYVFVGKANVGTSTTIFAKNPVQSRSTWWLNGGLSNNGLPSIWQDTQKAVGPVSIADGNFHCTIIRAARTGTPNQFSMQTSVDGVWGTAEVCVNDTDHTKRFCLGGPDAADSTYRGSHTGLDYLVYDHRVTDEEAVQIAQAAHDAYGTANNGATPPPVVSHDGVGFYGDSITAADIVGAAARTRLSTLRGSTVNGTVQGFSGQTSMNLSPSGSIIAGAATAFQNANVGVISLMVGTNDAKNESLVSVATYIANIQAIVAYFFANVSTLQRIVIQQPITPTPEGGATDPYNEWDGTSATRLQEYQAALATLSIPNVTVGTLDGYYALRQPANYPTDQIHPDGAGATAAGNAWAESIWAGEAPAPTIAAITPASATVSGGQTQTFSTAVSPSSASQVGTFTLSGAGAFNAATRVYTAPAATSSVQTATITFTTLDRTRSASATISVPAIAVPQVATPTFSPAAGTYTSSQSVSIACATSGATIYYTTDNSTPTTASTVYSSMIAASATTTVRAIAVKSGATNSAVASATYTISISPPSGTGFTDADRATLAAIRAKTDLLPDDIATSILNAVAIDGKSVRQALQIISAAVAGKLSGATGNTIVIKGLDGTTTRITATVDADGNRAAVTYN